MKDNMVFCRQDRDKREAERIEPFRYGASWFLDGDTVEPDPKL
jgi:hypothetical protein